MGIRHMKSQFPSAPGGGEHPPNMGEGNMATSAGSRHLTLLGVWPVDCLVYVARVAGLRFRVLAGGSGEASGRVGGCRDKNMKKVGAQISQ